MGQSAYPNFESFEVVQTGIVNVPASASATNWTTKAHNLGYAPVPMAYLNNVNLVGITANGNIPLPTYTSASIDLVNHQFIFSTFLQVVADAVNVYFILFNSTGAPITALPVKYFLLRERAN